VFNFFSMANNYEERKIARFEEGDLLISTCSVTDSNQPYETAISHPFYNGGQFIIVEMYDTSKAARVGHKEWINKMTSDELPVQLEDVSTAGIALMCDAAQPSENSWRIRKKNN